MSQIDEAKERRLFEDACYDYYLKRAAAGEVDTSDAGDGSREALFWRHPDGTYGVQMFNAAWFGWQERALLAVQQAVSGALPTKITDEMHVAACKVLLRAYGLAGTPQRMLDAMRATAPQPAQPVSAKELVEKLHTELDKLHANLDAASAAPQPAQQAEVTMFNPASNSPETALQMAAVIALRDEKQAKKVDPVAWAYLFEDDGSLCRAFGTLKEAESWAASDDNMWSGYIAPLYTAPRQPQHPIGEVVAWPDDTNPLGVEWGEAGVPPVGTKLFASVPQPAQQPSMEICGYQFQDREGKWCNFINEDHYRNTVAEGSWPIREIYTAAQPAQPKLLTPEEGHRIVNNCKTGTTREIFRAIEQAVLRKNGLTSPQPAHVGTGKTAEQAIALWEHDFANPLTPEQAEDFARRERAFAARQTTSLCDCKGRFYDRCESAWEPYCVLGKSSEHAVVAVERAGNPKTLNRSEVCVLVDRSGLGTYFAPRSEMQMRYENCVQKFAKMIEDEVLKKNDLWPGSLIRATKPNAHMDGYVRTDRPNGDGL